LCNFINERPIQILIVICEIHQFHLHFSVFHVVFHVWGVFRVLLGRTFVFGLRNTNL